MDSINHTSFNPLVSIIIITYNDRKYICQAIDSALDQTYSNCEVIIVDDGSTDGTDQLINNKYSNTVKYLWKENGGMGSARYAGLQISSGKYIQHLDSDDILLPDKIRDQVELLERNPEIAFVYGRTQCFYDDELLETWDHPSTLYHVSGNLLNEILKNGNNINIGQTLTRKSWIDRIGKWDLSVKGCDDQDIMIRLAYAGASCIYLNEPVYMYRHTRSLLNPNNMVSRHNLIERGEGEIFVWQKLMNVMLEDNHPDLDLVKSILGEKHFNFGKILLDNALRKRALHHIYMGIRLNNSRFVFKFMFLVYGCLLPEKLLLPTKKFMKNILYYKHNHRTNEV
jgi:glycosyltransferase involved in cell wall biosynthesis